MATLDRQKPALPAHLGPQLAFNVACRATARRGAPAAAAASSTCPLWLASLQTSPRLATRPSFRRVGCLAWLIWRVAWLKSVVWAVKLALGQMAGHMLVAAGWA